MGNHLVGRLIASEKWRSFSAQEPILNELVVILLILMKLVYSALPHLVLVHLKLELLVKVIDELSCLINLGTELFCFFDRWTLNWILSKLEDFFAFSFSDLSAVQHDVLKVLIGLDDLVIVISFSTMRIGHSNISCLMESCWDNTSC